MVRTRGSGITIRTSTRTRRGRVQPARGKAQSVRGRGRLPKAPDVQEDAISDASSNHYENVSDDLAILDGSPNQKKRAQPDDGPATMNDLLDQQLVFQKKSEELQRAQDLNAERIRVLASITESQPSTSQTANQRHSLSNVYGGVKGKSSLQQVTSPLVVFPATNPTSVIMDAVELPTLTSDLAARCKEVGEHVHLGDLLP
ncbi:hypothetical protein RvY_13400 [Ramazzottius varieornatus]|uniref:Uncharacterized protein n=1 Tax=Ramazzottius varieornatus TaxID=947166 RepID=A0A1D1VV80_RAMVA|nr:hypothetical protein RvY_13400 [Ramazzottius varieornatus]